MHAPHSSISGNFSDWLVRKRIAISGVSFVALIGGAILLGVHPREIEFGHAEAIYLAGIVLLLGGLSLRSWAAGTLIKNQKLTISGPYRLVRNPLYAGSFGMIIGTCLITDQPLPLLLLVSPLIAVYALTVRHEERRLAKRYGDDWVQYAKSTHRFLPTWSKIEFNDWHFSQWIYNREYAAVAAVMAALTALEIWEELAR
jgi:protein-S-isoprenylcysteine O-methyltransferase Ste14